LLKRERGFVSVSFFDNYYFVSKSGEVSLTSVSNNLVEGTFEIDADGFNINDGNQIEATITGSFEAIGGNVVLPDTNF